MINILAQRWKVTDGRLVHVVHSNIQVMRGPWSGAGLCSPVLRCSSTPPLSPSSSAICISRLLSSPSSELLGHLQIRFRHLPCPWLHRDAFFERGLCFPCASSWAELTVNLSSGSPTHQVFCFAVVRLTLENVPLFRGATPRED